MPSAVVTMEKVADGAEGGGHGLFRFTRTGDLSEPLKVFYTIDETVADAATWGGDYYIAIPGSTHFGVGAATSDVVLWSQADNEFEELEKAVFTLVEPPPEETPYSISGPLTHTATITDNPPQVSASVVWYSMSGPTIGQVTLNRSGGNIHQPLTTWFEPEGTLTENGETITVVFAATAVFPADAVTLVLPIVANPMMGGIANVQVPGATTQGQRADQSAQINNLANDLLNPNDGPRFDDACGELSKIIKDLPLPLTYQEYLALRMVRERILSALPPPDNFILEAQVFGDKDTNTVDWRTLPPGPAVQAVVGGAGLVAGIFAVVPDWAKLQATIDAIITDLYDDVFAVRQQAADKLKGMITSSTLRGDMTRASLILGKVYVAMKSATDTDAKILADEIYNFGLSVHSMKRFALSKVRFAAMIVGWSFAH